MNYLDKTGLAYFWSKIKTYTADSIGDAVDTVGNYTINGYKINTNPVLNKSDIGLNNVTNDAQVKRSEMGVAGGVATLSDSGQIPASQLPSYVDDVLEYNNQSAFPKTGETGKIYIAKDTNLTYRWTGSAYSEISKSLALGETNSTAYAGDKGAANRAALESLPNNIITTLTQMPASNQFQILVNRHTKNGLNYKSGSVQSIIIPLVENEGVTNAGLMSPADKDHLDDLWSSAISSVSGNDVTLGSNTTGNVGTITLSTSNVGGGDGLTDTISITVPLATISANGVMSSADKTKLDGIGSISNQTIDEICV